MENREIKFRAWDGEEFLYLDYAEGDIYRCGSFKGIQQYSGLKDKGFNDIYEGDIVYTPEGVSEVVFCNGGFGGVDINNEEWVELSDIQSKYIAVIGNIFENRELL